MIAPFNILLDILFPSSCFMCKKTGPALCNRCLSSTKKAFDTPHPFIMSIFSFKDQNLRRAIHAAKFFHRKDILIPLGLQLAETLTKTGLVGTIIPIPMHPLRKMVRGYNQAEILAEVVARTNSLPLETKILVRKKLTKRQAITNSKGARLRNQRGAFTVSKNVSGTYILIDDVTTTGATLLEARNLLLNHGASSVYAITVAH